MIPAYSFGHRSNTLVQNRARDQPYEKLFMAAMQWHATLTGRHEWIAVKTFGKLDIEYSIISFEQVEP